MIGAFLRRAVLRGFEAALDEGNATAMVDQDHRGCPRAVSRRGDERGGKNALPLEPDAGAWQLMVVGAPLLAQCDEQAVDDPVLGKSERPCQGIATAGDFGPRRVEQMIAEA